MKKMRIGLFICFCIIFLLVGCTGQNKAEKENDKKTEAYENADKKKEDIKQHLSLVVYFEKETTDEQKKEMQKQIAERPEVLEVKYISAEEAWEIFQKEYFGEDVDALSEFEENPLANSDNFEVYVSGTEKEIQNLISYIENMKGVRKVNSSTYEVDEKKF